MHERNDEENAPGQFGQRVDRNRQLVVPFLASSGWVDFTLATSAVITAKER